jgi:uncharacterized Zn-finger protein
MNYCNLCQKEYKNSKSLYTHNKTYHSNVKTYLCDYCNKSFVRKYNLGRHTSSCALKVNKENELVKDNRIVSRLINILSDMNDNDLLKVFINNNDNRIINKIVNNIK